ncbi:MAG: hypothetical protein A2015_12920 [Spirochaetes bacterium GWF1_31_7]|nr:MAG: hypothetical protein A2Y30_00325 [Spirochaetes bacterium GWE1_32_154]OHD51287.1 MAG: hypothetical protein A2Y29_00770 [Spirochaetes bacterium GWE2_31_10]OHD51484.1 MAG: hypothetical protein A2015_12920 [Spirochaetes bacterium GWF1_31_7]HBD93649.1 hypothetical protein [Spirochaetia bacterium]HBI38108.1 hypothetical protein [Spirochaetia bacterium]
MNIERLEILLKKVESAAGIITILKENEKIYKQQIQELNSQLQIITNQNTELKDKMSNSEKIHDTIEQKIINILERLPDFENIESNTPVTTEKTENQSIHSEPVIESKEEKEDNKVIESETITSFASEPEEVDTSFSFDFGTTEKNNIISDDNTISPQFDEHEDSEEVYSNMFAFDDIIDDANDSESSFFEQEDIDLPKGVL